MTPSNGRERAKFAIDGGHLFIAVLALLFTMLAQLASFASWKGSVDDHVQTMQKQLDRMDDKLDRLMEAGKMENGYVSAGPGLQR